MSAPPIGNRIKSLREKKNISQEEAARLFGFKDRQTISAIETGERRVSAEELLRACQVLGAPLDYFTDPFLLAGEGQFSWRQNGVIGRKLNDYEVDAGRFIAAFRAFDHEKPLLRRALAFGPQSSFEDATDAGERFADMFELGEIPAARLAGVMEDELGILVLMVDPIKGVSGAACRLTELDVVLINRREPLGRRNFDLAHELFHLLTWDAMPPEHVEDVTPKKRDRTEQLADNFASALLMPQAIIEGLADWASLDGDALIAALNKGAEKLQVTSSALRWRLVAMGKLGKIIAGRIPEDRLRNHGQEKADEVLPPLFSKKFVETIARAIDEGRVAVRRASWILGLSIDELGELFAVHGVKAPFEL